MGMRKRQYVTYPITFLASEADLAGLSLFSFGSHGPVGPGVTRLTLRATHARDAGEAAVSFYASAVAFVVGAWL